MRKFNFFKSLFFLTILSVLIYGGFQVYNFQQVEIAFAWTEPSTVPPAGNAAAPLNVSSQGQSKAGGLILNTGGAAIGLIVD